MNQASTKFDDHLRAVAWRNGQGAVLFLAVFVALLWPTDLIFFRAMPEAETAIGWVRLAVIASLLASWLLLRSPLGRRHPMLILGAGGAAAMFAVGWAVGGLAGPEGPWIHDAYPALFFTVPAPLRRRGRIMLVLAMAAALLAGFFGLHPEHCRARAAGLMLSFVGSMCVLVVAVGELAFRMLRQSFDQSLELERTSKQLAELNETLESRVRAQTHDLRRLTEHLEHAREEERSRVARELHDQLGQELTALNLALALTQQRFARDPQCIRGNLGELEALVSRTRATTRQIVTELRPHMLDELGLIAGLEWLARQTEQRSQLRCRLSADAPADLPSDLSTIAFRIVQEALTNVVRHARATEVEVTMAVRGGQLAIAVSDDGVGLPATPPPSGFGLIGMRERLATRAGRLELRARPGGGTTLAVTLPLNPVEEARS